MAEAKAWIASLTHHPYHEINMLRREANLAKPPALSIDERVDDAEDALARLDERLRQSPIREGWVARTHMLDSAANLWLEGDLVALEDLVLHDCSMDIRTPTHELTRAHMMLSARRRIAASPPGWALDRDSQAILLGQLGEGRHSQAAAPSTEEGGATPLDAEFAAIDALIARTTRRLSGGTMPGHNTQEAETSTDRLSDWQAGIAANSGLPPVAAAAAAGQSWDELRPIENASWLGRLLAAEILRIRGKTRVHLCQLNLGLKSVARADRQSHDPSVRHRAWVQGFALAAEIGLRDHDRWLATRQSLEHKLKGRRSTSKLPGLVDLVMRQPLVSSAIIAKELRVTTRAAQDLAGELGLREMTGRGRYRAWGIL